MKLFKSIFICALFAGFAGGVTLTGLQTLKVYPLIFAAEAFETAEPGVSVHSHTPEAVAEHSHAEESVVAENEEWMPSDGAERLYFSLQSNILIGIGMGLVLSAIFAVRGIINWRQGLTWGLAGFVAVNLAPAVGLAPELPGMPAADLLARQTWWWGTVAATAAGLALIFIGSEVVWRVAGVALILVPHIIGAPHPENIASDVPAVLAADFAAVTLATNMVFWAILGIVAAIVTTRQNQENTVGAT
jgi:cobalt transporter subunit CbtA